MVISNVNGPVQSPPRPDQSLVKFNLEATDIKMIYTYSSCRQMYMYLALSIDSKQLFEFQHMKIMLTKILRSSISETK